MHDTIVQAKQKGYTQLAEDLEREYYTTIPVLKQIFESNGFHITFTQFNHFVWVIGGNETIVERGFNNESSHHWSNGRRSDDFTR